MDRRVQIQVRQVLIHEVAALGGESQEQKDKGDDPSQIEAVARRRKAFE
jgi:hypothetical protein